MRTLCDACESAAAVVFCAADEAALCSYCDEKVHKCNKLANRHVRVNLADPSDVQRCDICENAPAFFYCEIDGSSLCLQCDMVVHVGGKRTHRRYLLLRQRVEFPDKPGNLEELGLKPLDSKEAKRDQKEPRKLTERENHQNHRVSSVPMLEDNVNAYADSDGNVANKLIDLNEKPQQVLRQASSNGGMDVIGGSNHEAAGVFPVGSFKREPDK